MELGPLAAPRLIGVRDARDEALYERHLGVKKSEAVVLLHEERLAGPRRWKSVVFG